MLGKSVLWKLSVATLLSMVCALAILAFVDDPLVAAASSAALFVLVGVLVGSMASTWASVQLERKRRELGRENTLRALTNEVKRIQAVAWYVANMGTGFATAMPQMPTRSFEQALFSGGNVINAGEDLLVGVTEYLKAADVINSLAKIVIATSNLDTQSRASTVRREALKKAVDMSARLAAPRGPAVGPPEERLLDRLARLLREELDQTR